MNQFFSRIFIVFSCAFLLAGCQVASPINTTNDFLGLLQQNQYQEAAELVVTQDANQLISLSPDQQTEWVKKTQETLGEVRGFSVQNAVPLSEDQLTKLGIKEGYDVFFELESAKKGSQHLEGTVVKVNTTWKLLPPDF